MNPTIKPLSERQAWNALAAHHQSVRELHLRQALLRMIPNVASV